MELVSIAVATYNSEETIIELLDSIAKQSYPDIELIVADDCSQDETVKLVRSWCHMNQARFHRILLTVSRKRQGVAFNADRAIYKSKAKWIKLIGGDDVLLPNCIKDNMDFIKENPSICFVFSQAVIFGDLSAVREKRPVLERSYELLRKGDSTELLKHMYFPSPTGFFSHDLYNRLGGYDKRFPNWEDAPFYTKMICKNILFGFFDKETVKYRLHKKNHKIYRGFAIDFIKVCLLVRIPALIRHGEIKLALKQFRSAGNQFKRLLSGDLQK